MGLYIVEGRQDEDLPDIVDFNELFEEKQVSKNQECEKHNIGRPNTNDSKERSFVLLKNRERDSKLDLKYVGILIVEKLLVMAVIWLN